MTDTPHRRIRAGILMLAAALLIPALVPTPAQAHTMSFGTSRIWDFFLLPGQSMFNHVLHGGGSR